MPSASAMSACATWPRTALSTPRQRRPIQRRRHAHAPNFVLCSQYFALCLVELLTVRLLQTAALLIVLLPRLGQLPAQRVRKVFFLPLNLLQDDLLIVS